MGTSFFGGKGHGGGMGGGKPTGIHASGLNMASRAFSAPSYAGSRASMAANKDLGAAAAASQHGMSDIKKSVVSNLKGPKV